MKRNLPKLTALRAAGVELELPESTLARWNGSIQAKAGENTISIYGVIGSDYFGDGVTAASVAAALDRIGGEQVVLNINSPGGDFFEGVAIYNLLREHPRKVTARVIGIAASAASVIAMAGDEIQIARAGGMMIHNTVFLVAGHKDSMLKVAEMMGKFDAAMAEVYAMRTGQDKAAVAAMMDKETWFNGTEAVEAGFADDLLATDQVTDDKKVTNSTLLRLEAALTKSGMPRSERRALIKQAFGKPGAAEDTTPGAGGEVAAEAARITASFEALASTLSNQEKT